MFAGKLKDDNSGFMSLFEANLIMSLPKGDFPKSSSYVIIPKLQESIFSL